MADQDNTTNPDPIERGKEHRLLQPRLFGSLKGGFPPRWILATALGGAVGGVALQVGIGRGGYIWPIDCWPMGYGILGLLIGAPIGLAQSLVLERTFHRSGRSIPVAIQWALSTSLGCFLGGMASSAGTLALALLLMVGLNVDYTWMYRSGGFVLWASSILLSATAVSVLQKMILQRAFDSLRKWTWISVFGWCVSLTMGWGVAQITPGSDVVKGIVGGAIGGMMLGAITGGAVVRLVTMSHLPGPRW